MTYSSTELGHALVAAAKSEWSRVVRDIEPGRPDDRDHIERYFTDVTREDGRSWAWFLISRHPRGEARYIEQTMDGQWEQWCGLFVAYCAQRLIGEHMRAKRYVNISILPGIAYYVLPSTHRIADPSRWEEAGAPIPDRPDPNGTQPGDIFTVGDGSAGSHIGIVASQPENNNTIKTIEGNARGELGDGSHGEGVILRRRDVSDFAQLIRLDERHYRMG